MDTSGDYSDEQCTMSNFDRCNPQLGDVDEGDTWCVSTALNTKLLNKADAIKEFITRPTLQLNGCGPSEVYNELDNGPNKVYNGINVLDSEFNEADNCLDNVCGLENSDTNIASHGMVALDNGATSDCNNEGSGLEINGATQHVYDMSDCDSIYISDSDVFMSDEESECGDNELTKSRGKNTTGKHVTAGTMAGVYTNTLGRNRQGDVQRARRPGVYRVGTDDKNDLSFRSYVNGSVTLDNTGRKCDIRIMVDPVT